MQLADERTITELRERLAALEASRGERRPSRRRERGGRLRLACAVLAMTLLVALVPLATLAAGPFTDLNPGSGHNPNIQAIADAGITRGCNPPDLTQYCPSANVTREEMASFLARAAGLGGNPPVANAKTAQTVPDGSVTAAKLSSVGATPGQVLTATGNGVTWQTVASGNGAQGPQGPAGTQGPAGPAGPQGSSGLNYARTIVVGPVGTAAQNGAALLSALAGITDAGSGKPYLLKIEPGTYGLGASPLAMKDFVDIEGSGEGVTTITGITQPSCQSGTVILANAELRFLTVTNLGGGICATALYQGNTANARITHVTIGASGATNSLGALLSNGALMRQSTIFMPNVGSVGVDLQGGTATLVDVDLVSGNVGVYSPGSGTLVIHNSRLKATGNVLQAQAGATIDVAGSQIVGGVSGGTTKCVGSFNATFDPLPAACH